ncbi:MAG: hypothetical protein EKK64_03160 [Neisseriaceae bacterium]|nr:MAG: hypothetical protein EKK64_03160 [Neisseriaceae bacterium]
MKKIKAGCFYNIPDRDGFLKEFQIEKISIDEKNILARDSFGRAFIFNIDSLQFGIESWQIVNKSFFQKLMFKISQHCH